MRTIKYRALDNFGEWIYGIPQTSSTLHLTLDCIAQYFTEQRKYGRENVIVKPETLGEFTGFYDKRGVEIFEGDILSDWNEVDGKQVKSKRQVYWCEKTGAWKLDNSFNQDKSCGDLLSDELESFVYEITGNIHEAPHT